MPKISNIILTLHIFLSFASAFTITTFAGSSYNSNTTTMNATLGISGYQIEDFENTTLLNNLTVQYGSNTPISTLPVVYNPASTGFSNNTWDGTYALTNGNGNTWSYPYAQFMTFAIAGGASSFGIGLANFQTDATQHKLYVNNVEIATLDTLANWTSGISVRNIYLRIDAVGSEVINSVKISWATQQDGLVFDHLAMNTTTIPEPCTGILIVIGALLLKLRKINSNE